MLEGLRRSVAALLLSIGVGAGVAVALGVLELGARQLPWARYLPLVCVFYLLAGAAAGVGGWLCLVALRLSHLGRTLDGTRRHAFVLAAVLASCGIILAVLELSYRFLPHELGLPTVSLAALGGVAIAAITLLAGRSLPNRVVRVVNLVLLAIPLAALVVAASWQPGTIRRAPGTGDGPDAEAPDIVMVLIDTLRADHLSSYGYPRDTSPYIDALAAKSIRFERAFAQAPWTKPSVESLFTSRFPSSISGTHVYARIPDEIPTLAETLRDAGYVTAGFVSNPVVNPTFGFDRGFHHFYFGLLDLSSLRLYRYALWLDLDRFPWYANRSDYLNRHVLAWLDQFQTAPPRRPLFLYVHYMDPHEPYVSDETHRQALATPGVEPIDSLPHPLPRLLPFDAEPSTARSTAEIQGRIDAYDACIRQNDEAVGELLDELKSRELWENTVFVLVSDHGEEFAEHGGWGHGQSLYQELIHVPLLLRVPGIAGESVGHGVMLVDLLPTLAQLAGALTPENVVGRDLLAPNEPGARLALAEARLGEDAQRAVIRDRWKWIRATRGEERRELVFDLAEDAAELHNLIGAPSSEQANRARAVSSSFASLADARLEEASGAETTDLDEGLRLRLEALGYTVE